ncbi:MAG TPA: copper chaperone PCu(A)C [Phenylobacterium sp.]|nr:copper chaperone PCu(A)C [Phenylobacterium sp.]
MKIRALIPLLTLAACSPKAEAPLDPRVEATDAWCRPAPAGALSGACYLTLTAATDDRLTTVESPAAGHVEIHTMDMTGGVMRMRQLPKGVELSRGEPATLKPGGLHLMLIGPKSALALGGKVPLTLRFEKAPAVTLEAEVRQPPAPTG